MISSMLLEAKRFQGDKTEVLGKFFFHHFLMKGPKFALLSLLFARNETKGKFVWFTNYLQKLHVWQNSYQVKKQNALSQSNHKIIFSEVSPECSSGHDSGLPIQGSWVENQ